MEINWLMWTDFLSVLLAMVIFRVFLKFCRLPTEQVALERFLRCGDYIQENFAWKVKEDDMLIFPSALNHEIKAQGPTKEPRITIATNLKILSQEK